MLTRRDILDWLRERDPERVAALWRLADDARRRGVGDDVHLRGLIEISNHCVRQCAYCGIRAGRRGLARYRMTPDEILAAARLAVTLGYGTVVLQAGEDPGLTAAGVAELVRRLKGDTPLAVTLSLGERDDAEFARWREAGADRYLLRFETANRELYDRIHPAQGGRLSDRLAQLRRLRELGYEVGSGVMIGIPGQTWDDLAADIALFGELDLDMIGVGPFLAHPDTPLGAAAAGAAAPGGAQVPGDEETTLRAIALARLVCPWANIPSTTALATINRDRGREHGLERGANVVMPNLTPARYRAGYEIYPDKACLHEVPEACAGDLRQRIEGIGRRVGAGPGHARDHRAAMARAGKS
ncbi:MAG: [FeFe] hydrogenase H-cluster radical SAM maturase HydE [Candidatus Krumholzibacteriia bacterium]